MDVDADDVKMVVVDGLVIAPTVNYINHFIITYINFILQALCTSKMHQGSKECQRRGTYGEKCHIIECQHDRIPNSLAC